MPMFLSWSKVILADHRHIPQFMKWSSANRTEVLIVEIVESRLLRARNEPDCPDRIRVASCGDWYATAVIPFPRDGARAPHASPGDDGQRDIYARIPS